MRARKPRLLDVRHRQQFSSRLRVGLARYRRLAFLRLRLALHRRLGRHRGARRVWALRGLEQHAAARILGEELDAALVERERVPEEAYVLGGHCAGEVLPPHDADRGDRVPVSRSRSRSKYVAQR